MIYLAAIIALARAIVRLQAESGSLMSYGAVRGQGRAWRASAPKGRMHHRVTTQVAALNYLDHARAPPRADRQEPWIRLLADNDATFRPPKPTLAKRPRFNMFPPSRMILGGSDRRCVRSASFASARELVDDINAYLAECNANPQPPCDAKGEAILSKTSAVPTHLEKAEAA